MSIITVDYISGLNTKILKNIKDIGVLNSKQIWRTLWEGQAYLNDESYITCDRSVAWDEVSEIQLIFSAYNTDTKEPIDGNVYNYRMVNDSDLFFAPQNIAIPKGNDEGSSDWEDFFYIKSFKIEEPNSMNIIGQGTTQTDGGNHACVLRKVLYR